MKMQSHLDAMATRIFCAVTSTASHEESFGIVRLALVIIGCFTACAARCAEAPDGSERTYSLMTAGGNPAESTSPLWRSLSLSRGINRYDYREPDPAGRVHPFNTESGNLQTDKATISWIGAPAKWLPILAVQTNLVYTNGSTNYSGYLQNGNALTTYHAKTENRLDTGSLRIGIPIEFEWKLTGTSFFVLYAEHGLNRWRRSLIQYDENFRWKTTGVGAMALWPLSETLAGTATRLTLELDASFGKSSQSTLRVPSLKFESNLSESANNRIALTLKYSFSKNYFAGLSFENNRNGFGSSPALSGLQYPGAVRVTKMWHSHVGVIY